MFLTEYAEYNIEKIYEEAWLEGYREGRKKAQQEIASRMLKNGSFSVLDISEITQLSEDAVLKLAKTLDVDGLTEF